MACRFCIPDGVFSPPKPIENIGVIPPCYIQFKRLTLEESNAQFRKLYDYAVNLYSQHMHLLDHSKQWHAENVFMRELLNEQLKET